MLNAEDYLDLRPDQARSQWLRIVARHPLANGRQEDFTPVETLLCLAAGFVVNHRRYGGSTSQLAPSPVPELAAVFRRPASSILAKMANLDGSRRNGARYEIHVASVLLTHPEQLAALYRIALAAGRDAGLGSSQLPDFLGLGHDEAPLLLDGQDELDVGDVESAVEPETARWAAERNDVLPAETERLLIGAVRVGQHRFAGQVLANHGLQCGFCGLRQLDARPGVRGLISASHIKPWRQSSPSERLDARNGIAACPTHDVAFDTGLLTVDRDLGVQVSQIVQRAIRQDPAAEAVFGRPPLANRLLLPAHSEPPTPRYLDWHGLNVFVRAA